MRVQRSPRSKSQIVHIDKIKKVLGPTPRSWLKREPNDGVVENGGEAARAQQDDALDPDPLEDQADLPSEVGQESIPNAAPETATPRVSVNVGRPPVSNQIPTPTQAKIPPVMPARRDRPQREIRKPARFVDRVCASTQPGGVITHRDDCTQGTWGGQVLPWYQTVSWFKPSRQ